MDDSHDGLAESASVKVKSAITNGSPHSARTLDDTTHAKQLSDMREAISKHGGRYEEGGEAKCLCFLVQCSMNAEKAAAMFVRYQKWRASYMPLGYIADDEVGDLLATGMMALQGHSKKGWPIYVAFASNNRGAKHSLESWRRYLVYVLEKARASAPGLERLMMIVDLKHLALKDLQAKVIFVGFQLEQKYYPGILAKLYMVNSPKFFIDAWKVVTKMLPKSNRDRIVFLEKHDIANVLLGEVDADVLPKIYGGKAEVVLVQDVHPADWGPSAQA